MRRQAVWLTVAIHFPNSTVLPVTDPLPAALNANCIDSLGGIPNPCCLCMCELDTGGLCLSIEFIDSQAAFCGRFCEPTWYLLANGIVRTRFLTRVPNREYPLLILHC